MRRFHVSHTTVLAVVLTGLAAVFGINLFLLHHDAAGHGLDITAPLALERILAALRLAAEE